MTIQEALDTADRMKPNMMTAGAKETCTKRRKGMPLSLAKIVAKVAKTIKNALSVIFWISE